MVALSMVNLSAFLLASVVWQASASSFLKPLSPVEKSVSRGAVEQTLATALSMDLRELNRIKEEFKPLHATLPKNEHGTLESAVVRYALHRYFVQKHGWFMKGLDPRVSPTNTSIGVSILKDRVPAYIQGVIDQNLKGQGWGLHELAIYAAALTDLVRVEATEDLEVVYEMLSIPTAKFLTQFESELVTTAYALHYTLEENHTFATFNEMRKEVQDTYPGWEDFNMWAQDVRQTMAYTERARFNPFTDTVSFQQMVLTVQEIGHRYGSFQTDECSSLTSKLLGMELEGTGRISLTTFYEAGVEGTFRFWESEEYLRFLGALDEHNPDQKTLIIANFLSSQSNCVGSSSFFSVCCTNECESLMTRLESKIGSPEATVEHLVKTVSEMGSETVDVPRTLSKQLVSRLDEIAEHHDGKVPIHGRLFAQWMHHAYVRDCPYPHVGHTRNPLAPEAWTEASGIESVLSDQQLRQLMQGHGAKGEDVELPWAMTEDLMISKRGTKASYSSTLRIGMAVLALGSFMVPLMRATKVVLAPEEKIHCV